MWFLSLPSPSFIPFFLRLSLSSIYFCFRSRSLSYFHPLILAPLLMFLHTLSLFFSIIFQSRLYFLHSFSVSPLFSPSTIFFDSLFPLFFLFVSSISLCFLFFSSLHYFSFKGFPLDMFLMFWAFHLSEYLKVHIFLGIQACGNISPRKC